MVMSTMVWCTLTKDTRDKHEHASFTVRTGIGRVIKPGPIAFWHSLAETLSSFTGHYHAPRMADVV